MDDFNTGKHIMRMTTDRIPNSLQLQKDLSIPICLSIKPYGDNQDTPLVDFGYNTAIIRCNECQAYINPFVKFVDNGRVWVCNFCQGQNQTPEHYYAQTDAQGQRIDIEQRPELIYGTIDIKATPDFLIRAPVPPTYLFLFDVTQDGQNSGYLYQATQTIKSLI